MGWTGYHYRVFCREHQKPRAAVRERPQVVSVVHAIDKVRLRVWNGSIFCAYILVAHAAVTMIARGFDPWVALATASQDRVIFGAIALKVLIIWMLISHLRHAAPIVTNAPVSANRPVLKVALMQDDRLFVDGVHTTLEHLTEALARLKDQDGTVWYYREGTAQEAPPASAEVMQAILEAGTTCWLSSLPDYSDSIGPDGASTITGDMGPR